VIYSTEPRHSTLLENASAFVRPALIIVTLRAWVSDDVVSPLRSMCDAALKLRVEQDGNRMVKTLEVSKCVVR
jgi:archaellum biogenesis ATPase FlaH